jgi:ADP-ribose pyrophosphatase YjhB (NUDIX family)
MIDTTAVNHHIQKHILSVLMHQRYARFRDMRPPRVDSNLYSYHLKLMMKNGLVDKTEQGYTLGLGGVLYVDRVSTASVSVRQQPKIITMLVVQNSEGDILLYKKSRQPFIDLWNLPQGKLHIDDESIQAAARREIKEKIGDIDVKPEHAGDCYIRMKRDGEVVMSTLAHVFRFESDEIAESESLHWARPHKLHQYELAPAIEQIIARTFFRDPYFFEEFEVDW